MTAYLWAKSLHVIFMVTWFAGLFYLPRLFVYHAETRDDAGNERFKVMERKLFWGIMTPGAVLTAGFGLWIMAMNPQAYVAGWMHLKLLLVALLIAYHIWCGLLVRDFKRDANRHTHQWYRWFNEIPVFMLVGIVVLVIGRQVMPAVIAMGGVLGIFFASWVLQKLRMKAEG
ncbi:TIGR00701 family protein [Thioalkalivibrio denitrificans]|uniref:Protoporphyrinogen IX oxidase n=1 Tax=Thioalkalivibrio denitrificans TaxID=108003 RepID=A0A1V3NUG4_9GAMM|nr:protoporphyrinogen oxidase HemJ [Thioalkalivibrio denitrificans]OOG28779.1 TIGR00701 family protein [Thioalkalivibrio denitrificans]